LILGAIFFRGGEMILAACFFFEYFEASGGYDNKIFKGFDELYGFSLIEKFSARIADIS
jgi:hypothetical protein